MRKAKTASPLRGRIAAARGQPVTVLPRRDRRGLGSDQGVEQAWRPERRLDILIINARLAGETLSTSPSGSAAPDLRADLRHERQRHLAGPARRPPVPFGRGTVIDVSSVSGRFGVPGAVGNVRSQHAVIGVTPALALELAPRKITVNAVCPGWVDTGRGRYGIRGTGKAIGLTEDQAFDAARGWLRSDSCSSRTESPSSSSARLGRRTERDGPVDRHRQRPGDALRKTKAVFLDAGNTLLSAAPPSKASRGSVPALGRPRRGRGRPGGPTRNVGRRCGAAGAGRRALGPERRGTRLLAELRPGGLSPGRRGSPSGGHLDELVGVLPPPGELEPLPGGRRGPRGPPG